MSGRSVVNLSNYELTKDEISVLSKGLKFCPTPETPDAGEVRQDMDRLHKRLRQIAFYDKPVESTADSSQATVSLPVVTPDLGDNLHSVTPFKHRKFKEPSKGRGPIGPLNLEAMVLCNEQQLNARPTVGPPPQAKPYTR
jgi:hypothetical protein